MIGSYNNINYDYYSTITTIEILTIIRSSIIIATTTIIMIITMILIVIMIIIAVMLIIITSPICDNRCHRCVSSSHKVEERVCLIASRCKHTRHTISEVMLPRAFMT